MPMYWNVCFLRYFCLQQRQNLQIQISALQSDYDNLNARYEEESEAASILRNSLSKANCDLVALKTKYDKEVVSLREELESVK